MYNQPFSYIDDDAGLLAVCTTIEGVPAIAIDTEFVREDTYFPKPALLQLHYGEQVCLIDPLSITNFEPLVKLLRDPSLVKVMHSCSEDMEVFNTLFQALPVNIFDTQVAAALCGMGFSLGYQKLIDELIGHELTKTETRSKWLQRPLSEEQCQYALHDVLWLLDSYHLLQTKLAQLGRQAWCAEECQRICNNAAQVRDDEQLYLRVKAAWRLPPTSLAVLQSLCAWREQLARSENIPKGRIATDSTLVDIALQLPENRRALAQAAQIRQSTVRRWGEQMLARVAGAVARPASEAPPPLAAKGDRRYRNLLRDMQGVTREVAQAIDLPSELLGKKRDLEDYIENRRASLIGQGWREPLLAAKLDALLDGVQPGQA